MHPRSFAPRGTLIALAVLLAAAPAAAQHAHPASHTPTDTGGLGVVHFPNSGARAAQAPFQRGVALLHNFHFDEAREAFRQARAADPGFALAYWMEALTHNQLVWALEDTAAARTSLRTLAPTPQARLARARTARERGFGEAVEALYADGAPRERARAFAGAMRRHADALPTDLEASAFAAAALLTHAVTAGPPEGPRLHEEAARYAQRVLDTSPRHPGAAHYVVHAWDAPGTAARALAAARAYAAIAPDSEHALHMPSHIFVQLGLWDDAAASDERAWAASHRNSAGAAKNDVVNLGWHSLLWLNYAYLQQGRARASAALLDTARHYLAAVEIDADRDPDQRFVTSEMAFAHAYETGDWSAWPADSTALSARVPSRTPPALSRRAWLMQIGAAYRAGAAAAFRGDTAMAARVAAELRAYAEPIPPRFPVHPWLRLAATQIDGLVARRAGEPERAVALLTEAAALDTVFGSPVGPWTTIPAREMAGRALLEAGRPGEALPMFENSLALQPNRPKSLLGLARARRAAGDTAGAADAYRGLVDVWKNVDPDFPGLAEARAWASGAAQASTDWTREQQITAAVLPLPKEMRAGAGVVAFSEGTAPITLREGTNGMMCMADLPGDEEFDVRCFQQAFFPVYVKMRETELRGLRGMVRHDAVDEEIRSGRLRLPDGPTAGWMMEGPISAYDAPTAVAGPEIEVWQTVHAPYRTAAQFGLPEEPDGTRPYVMGSGTFFSHVMVAGRPAAP